MTIRAGALADNAAISMYKIEQNGQFLGGAILSGFGTKPIPGAICDDAIARVVEFTAHHIQRVINGLLERQVADMHYAQQVLKAQLQKINDSVNYVNRYMGQAVYITGVICYVAHERYLCLPFGGSHAYLWTGTEFTPQKNQNDHYEDPLYIYDAIGGGNAWTAIFQEGEFPVGSQLLCMTQRPPEGLMEKAMGVLTHTNQEIVASTLHEGLPVGNIPRAVLNIAQAAHLSNPNAEGTTEENTLLEPR